jgi:hypothetical protein
MASERSTQQASGGSSRSSRFTPGALVKRADADEVGVVTTGDEWWDTFQLPGVAVTGQVLVEWPHGGFPVRRWERRTELSVIPEGKTADAPVVDDVDKA